MLHNLERSVSLIELKWFETVVVEEAFVEGTSSAGVEIVAVSKKMLNSLNSISDNTHLIAIRHNSSCWHGWC